MTINKVRRMDDFITARARAGFKTQGELAKAVGINESQVNRMENGKIVTAPRAYTIYRLAKALKINERIVLKWFL